MMEQHYLLQKSLIEILPLVLSSKANETSTLA